MTKTRTDDAPQWPSNARLLKRRCDLRCFAQDNVNMAIWDRPLPPAVAAEVAVLPFEAFPHQRVTTSRPERSIPRVFREHADTTGHPYPKALVADILMLANTYRALRQLRTVLLRLDAIQVQAFTRFHADGVEMRLMCTYRGPGTEWLSEDAFSRQMLETDGIDHAVKRKDIHRMAAGQVAMMRGDAWPRAIRRLRGTAHRWPLVMRPKDWRWFVLVDDARFSNDDSVDY